MNDIVLARRGFIGGLAALVAAPAVVKVESLMPVRGVPLYSARNLLTVDMITREAVRLFVNSNVFIQSINRQYNEEFGVEGAKIGTTLRIRLPNDFRIEDRNPLFLAQQCVDFPPNPYVYDKTRRTLIRRQAEINALHDVPAPLAVAAGVAAVIVKNPAVSRRFWSR